MRWATLVYVILFAVAAKGDGIDEAFKSLKARRGQYYEALVGGKTFKLTILDCFADQVKLKDLPYGKPPRVGTREAVISRGRVQALLRQETEGFKDSEIYWHVISTLIYDLDLAKWKREPGKLVYTVSKLPPGERRPKTKVTFEKQDNRYLVTAIEAAAPASGE